MRGKSTRQREEELSKCQVLNGCRLYSSESLVGQRETDRDREGERETGRVRERESARKRKRKRGQEKGVKKSVSECERDRAREKRIHELTDK